MSKISLLKNIYDKTSGAPISIVDFIKKIKAGEWKYMVEKIRSSDSEEQQNKLKLKLPAVTLAGVVENRKLLQPSGYIGIDLDAKDNKNLKTAIEKVKKDKYVAACWKSSKGRGYWLLFRINPKRHAESFQGISEYLLKKYSLTVDSQCKDPARLCFVPYDPEAKLKHTAAIFKQYSKKVKKEFQPVPTSSLEELQHITEHVVKSQRDITRDYEKWFKTCVLYAEHGEINRKLFHSVSEYHALYDEKETNDLYDKALKFVTDHANVEARQKVTLKSLYGYLKTARIKCPVFKKDSAIVSQVIDGKQMIHIDGYLYRWRLWEFNTQQKTGFRCRGVNPDGIGEFLHKNGFRVWGDSGRREIYQIIDNIVHKVSIDTVGDTVIKEMNKIPDGTIFCYDNIKDSITKEAIKSETQRTAKKVVEAIFLKTFSPYNDDLFLKDTPTETFFKFSNTVVKISKKIELIPYNSITKLIWANTIKPYDFSICKNLSVVEEVLDKAIGAEHKVAYMTAVGYMLNGYIHEYGSKILFCCDLNLISGINDGGNGKDFICQLLNQVRHVTIIPSRDIDFRNRFKFQEVDKDTELLWLEDLNKNVTMERLYNVTSSVNVERKNEQAFKTRIKVGVSLQHAIDMEGTSDKRRQIFLLFTNYFGQLKNGIAQEYGELLGKHFDLTARLYVNNFLARCCQLYHKKGIIQMPIDTLVEARKSELNDEIYSCLKLDHKYRREEMMDAVGAHNVGGMSPKQFTSDLARWARNCGYQLIIDKGHDSYHYRIASHPVVLKLHKGGKAAK